jgi:hypothetical protein
MIDEYLNGSIAQLVERARGLTALIPRDLPRVYDTLAQRCRSELARILSELRTLSDDIEIKKPHNRAIRMRVFKRVVADLDFIEATGVAALSRTHQDDHALNGTVGRIVTEIRYPLPAPSCTGLSRDYFYINPHLGLLFVPLAEAHFLLHLPDLFHELAHPLLTTEDDPIIEPFQVEFSSGLKECLFYVETELSRLDRGRHPESLKIALRAWESSWVRGWLAEFFCDLFAVFTVGPAFCWSHLHLALKRGTDPFIVPEFSPTTHPADDARMRAALIALRKLGFNSEADEIGAAWCSALLSLGNNSTSEYVLCFDDRLLHKIVDHAFQGTAKIGVVMYSDGTSTTIARMLNEAWVAFWNDTDSFVATEKQLLRSFSSFAPSKPTHKSGGVS